MPLAPPVAGAAAFGRIAQIQARFEGSTSTTTSTGDAASFSGVLSSLLGGDGGALGSLLGSQASLADLLGSGAAGAAAVEGSGSGVDGDDVVDTASKYLGIPYRWGGTNPSTGLDCSGLVQLVYKELGYDLPRVSRDQARAGTPVASIADARPGDLVAFGSPVRHIGIYIGDGRFLEAPRTGDVVKISPMRNDVTAIRRILPDEGGTTSGAAALSRLGFQSRTVGNTVDLRSPRTPTAGSASTGVDGPLPAGVPYRDLFESAASTYGIPSRLLAALAKEESGYRNDAVSSVGALGIMQFMPATARGIGIDPLDPAQAINGAARYLRAQIDRFGSTELALAAYNAGPGAVARAGGVPPYTETRNAIRKVNAIIDGGTW